MRDPDTYEWEDDGTDHSPLDSVARENFRPRSAVWNRVMYNITGDIHYLFDELSEIEPRITDLEDLPAEIDSLETRTNRISSNGTEAYFDDVGGDTVHFGSDTSDADSGTLTHPSTDQEYDFGPDGTFTTDHLNTGGGDSDLHYKRIHQEIYENESVDADISIEADRGQLIKINSFRPNVSSSLYLRFDGVEDDLYYYKTLDANTHEPTIQKEASEITLIDNIYESEEFPSGGAWRGEVVNTRSSRPGIIGNGVSRRFEEGEEFLTSGSFNRSQYPDEINIYTNDGIEEVEIEVYEPVPDSDRPTDDWG
jgi:hypothetical protein